jgi:hypothetical protein
MEVVTWLSAAMLTAPLWFIGVQLAHISEALGDEE